MPYHKVIPVDTNDMLFIFVQQLYFPQPYCKARGCGQGPPFFLARSKEKGISKNWSGFIDKTGCTLYSGVAYINAVYCSRNLGDVGQTAHCRP